MFFDTLTCDLIKQTLFKNLCIYIYIYIYIYTYVAL